MTQEELFGYRPPTIPQAVQRRLTKRWLKLLDDMAQAARDAGIDDPVLYHEGEGSMNAISKNVLDTFDQLTMTNDPNQAPNRAELYSTVATCYASEVIVDVGAW